MAGASASATTTNENLSCRFWSLSDEFHMNYKYDILVAEYLAYTVSYENIIFCR